MDLAVFLIAPTADRRAAEQFAATQVYHMAAQDPPQAGRLLVPRLRMPVQRTQPQLIAAAVDMPAAKNVNRKLLNKTAGWVTSGGANRLRRFVLIERWFDKQFSLVASNAAESLRSRRRDLRQLERSLQPVKICKQHLPARRIFPGSDRQGQIGVEVKNVGAQLR